MMKNILVLAGGGDNDEAVFATALAAAQPFHAHLEFLHVQIGPGEAAAWEPHAEFLRGPHTGSRSSSKSRYSTGRTNRGDGVSTPISTRRTIFAAGQALDPCKVRRAALSRAP